MKRDYLKAYKFLFDLLISAPDLPTDFDTEDGRKAFEEAYTEWIMRRDSAIKRMIL